MNLCFQRLKIIEKSFKTANKNFAIKIKLQLEIKKSKTKKILKLMKRKGAL